MLRLEMAAPDWTVMPPLAALPLEAAAKVTCDAVTGP
jgi:hypothetical protein